MRPKKLVLSAFCSYAERTELNLDSLSDRGVYLITGETGAGKTTLFDAIAFALYGEASGPIRGVETLRCKSASPETPTFVELTFVYRGADYFVRRNPEYRRPARRGDGEVTEHADAELVYPDGRTVNRAKDVTAAITELLGLDRGQFSRIAMIAQGEFQKMLCASTAERSRIFRDLFDTRKYEVLQNRLRDEAMQLTAKEAELRVRLSGDLDRILTDENDFPISEEAAEEDPAGLASALDALLARDAKRETELRRAIAEKEQSLEALDRAIGQQATARETAAALATAEQTAKANAEALRAAQQADDSPHQADLYRAADETVRALTEALPLYDGVETASRATAEAETAEKNAQLACDTTAGQLSPLLEKLENTRAFVAENRKAGEAVLLCRAAELCIKDATSRAETVAQCDARLQAAQAFVIQATDRYRIAARAMQEKQQQAAACTRAYLDAQAGVLSQQLQDGVPCPVCGSTAHPSPATLQPDAPTEEKTELTKAEAEAAAETAAVYARETAEATAAAAAAKAEADRAGEALTAALVSLPGTFPDAEDSEGRRAALQKAAEQAHTDLEKAEACAARVREAEASLPALSAQCEALQLLSAQNKEALQTVRVSLADARARLHTLTAQLPYETRANLLTARTEAQTARDCAEKQIAAARAAIEQAKERAAAAESAAAALRARYNSQPKLTDADLTQTRAAVFDVLFDLRGQLSAVTHRLDTNRPIRERTGVCAAALSTVRQQEKEVATLADTARGTLGGREKITLEAFVQRQMLDRVLIHANARFDTMTDGRYQLRRRTDADFQSKSGLGLDVYDRINAATRPVSSLSGGESFLASLSLALGLSDEVANAGNSARGVRLDTMFIDEGFGTLSEEYLRTAMQVLAQLSAGNRLIGIISHVEALREIERRIVVTKDRGGCSHAVIEGVSTF